MRDNRISYDAFISYSHAADGQLAAALQSGLHRLAKPFYRVRALNIFRDKTGLSATPALWASIEDSLRRSRYLIVLASPEAARSEWVTKEMAWWLQHKSADSLLLVLTSGTIGWNSTVQDFDWTATSALPPMLAGKFASEPLHVDMTWASTSRTLTLRDPRFLDAVLDLAATLHGRAKNDIAGEEIRQNRIVRSVSLAAVVVLAILTAVAWQQRGEAQRSAALALERQRVAEQRVRELCESWRVTTTFIEENIHGAIYDLKGRLHEVFRYEEHCPP